MNKQVQKKVRKKGARSPNYPVVSLKKSIEQVGQLYDTHKTHSVPVNMLHELWGYKAFSSVGDQCVAAAKAFGLIDIEGKSKARKISISEKGHRIHMKAPGHENLLKKAALSPPIHEDIWEHYNGDLPNDELLKNYLLWEHEPRFNEQYVSRFIDLFRETISFANLVSGSIIKENGTEQNVPETEQGRTVNLKGHITMTSQNGYFDMPIPLLDGYSAFLRVPRPMSEDNYNLIINFLNTIKPSITYKPKQDDEQDNMKENSNKCVNK